MNKKVLAQMIVSSRLKTWTNAEIVNEIIERSGFSESKWPNLDNLLTDFKEYFQKETGFSIEGWIL